MKHLSPSRTRPVYPRAPTFPIVAPGVLFAVQAEQRYASTTRAPWALIENAVSWRLRTLSQRRRGRRAQCRRLPCSCGHGRSHGGTVGCTALSGVVLGLRSHVFRAKVAISEITRVPSVDLTPRRLAPLALILWLRLVARTRCVFRLLLRRLRDARGRVFHVKHAVSPVVQECHRCARSAAILCCKLVLTLSTRRYPRSARGPGCVPARAATRTLTECPPVQPQGGNASLADDSVPQRNRCAHADTAARRSPEERCASRAALRGRRHSRRCRSHETPRTTRSWAPGPMRDGGTNTRAALDACGRRCVFSRINPWPACFTRNRRRDRGIVLRRSRPRVIHAVGRVRTARR